MKYEWRHGYHAVKAQVAGEEMERIKEANGGLLTPAALVEASRPEDTPMHDCFTWDHWRAAELYRQEEARREIRSLATVYEPHEEPASTIAYVHIELRGPEGESRPGYVSTAQALTDEEYRRQVVADALSLLEGTVTRYQDLAELRGVFEAIEQARRDFEAQHQRPSRKTRKQARQKAK